MGELTTKKFNIIVENIGTFLFKRVPYLNKKGRTVKGLGDTSVNLLKAIHVVENNTDYIEIKTQSGKCRIPNGTDFSISFKFNSEA